MRTPTVLQMEAAECGAASLTMILNFFGRSVLLEEVRDACAVSRDGVNAAKMVSAAESFGLLVRAEKRGVRALFDLSLPLIVFWNQNHFLVVEGFGRSKVYLNDPASGRRSVSYAEFDESYSRIVLVFEPGPAFRADPRRARPRPLRALLHLLGSSRSGVVYAVVAGLAVAIPTTAVALLLSLFVAKVLGLGESNWVWKIVGAAFVVVIAQIGLTLFQQRILLRLQTRLSIRMSVRFLWHLLRLRTAFFDARSPGGLVSRMQLNDQLAQLLSIQLATAVFALLNMGLYAAVMLVLDWRLAIVAIALAACNFVALFGVSRARVSANQQLQHQTLRVAGYTFMGVHMIEDIKATGAEDELFGRWAGTQASAVNTSQRLGAFTQGLLVVPGLLATLSVVAVLAVGGAFILRGSMDIGQLVAFQAILVPFLAPIGQLVDASSQFQDARAWLQQTRDVLNQPTDPLAPDPGGEGPPPLLSTGRLQRPAPQAASPRSPARLAGRLELRNVSFGYVPTEPPLIEDVSVTLSPGERIAFVGATGSGKSTIANLVAGLLGPWSGEIRFDGRRREEIPREVLTASLAKVDQTIRLFSGTIVENIRFWDELIPLTDVYAAVRDAALESEIQAKPLGYGHLLLEDGRNLSGGQRQRLELARALATNPSILVLDEATSALDVATEMRIDRNLRRRGCTCLIIAHRLSTIRDCDQIVVLDQGRVVERGRHEELIALDGVYRELVSHG